MKDTAIFIRNEKGTIVYEYRGKATPTQAIELVSAFLATCSNPDDQKVKLIQY